VLPNYLESFVTSLDVLNALAGVVGFLQYVQPWILYIIATYVHHLLLDERHKVPPQRRIRCPLSQLLIMIIAGALYFAIYLSGKIRPQINDLRRSVSRRT